MLKVHFLKKIFSIKKCFLDKSLLGPLEFQPHLLEAWRAAPQPGQGSRGETWRWQAQTMQPRGGPTGSSGACVFKAAAETVVAAAAAAGACAPHGCFCSTVGSSVAQLGRSKHNGGEERVNQRGLHKVEETERKHGSRTEGPLQPPLSTLRGSAHLLGRHEDRQAGGPTPVCRLGFQLIKQQLQLTGSPTGPRYVHSASSHGNCGSPLPPSKLTCPHARTWAF